MRKDGSLAVQDIGSMYSFNLNNTFFQTNFLHLGYKEVFEGNYRISKDTLLLFYIPIQKKERDYKFIQKNKIEENTGKVYLFLKIKLMNEEIRKSGVEMLVYDKKGKMLMGFSSDENGEYPFLSLFDSKIGYFLFSSLDYQEVKIPASELFGYSSEIHIQLKKSFIINGKRNDTIKYLVSSFGKRKIELRNIKTKEKVVLFKH